MINVAQVRLIDDKGENVGVKTIGEAMRMAADVGLDLVEISPNSDQIGRAHV